MLALESFRFVGEKFELVLTPFCKETPLGKNCISGESQSGEESKRLRSIRLFYRSL